MNGKEVIRRNTSSQKGKNQTEIDIASLVPGIYFVHIPGYEGDSSRLKFVKTNQK